MTEKYLVNCITKTGQHFSPSESIISHLGGVRLDNDGNEMGHETKWRLKKSEVIKMIQSGSAVFFSGESGIRTPVVVKVSDAGNEYLTTEPNQYISDNLSYLSDCE